MATSAQSSDFCEIVYCITDIFWQLFKYKLRDRVGKSGKEWKRLEKTGKERKKGERLGKSGKEWKIIGNWVGESGKEWKKVGKSGKEWEKVGKSEKEYERMGKSGKEWERVEMSGEDKFQNQERNLDTLEVCTKLGLLQKQDQEMVKNLTKPLP